jgi:DNA-binding transcriptional ArsR family regulator
VEDRRREVSKLLAQSLTGSEIAEKLLVDQSTISRDIKVLKEMSKRFIFDLAKSDLAFYYLQCIEGIEEVKKEARYMLRNQNLTSRDKLYALKLLKECSESKFALFKDGPSIMNVQTLENRLMQIENRQVSRPSKQEIRR